MSMIYQRLLVARNLLSPDGVMVVAIDENEFASLATMIKEVFGESSYAHSYVSIVHNPRGQQGINFSYVNEYLIFVYPNNGKKYLADFPKDEVDSRTLRDSGTESDRTDARMCFYPFYVKQNKIIRIGDVFCRIAYLGSPCISVKSTHNIAPPLFRFGTANEIRMLKTPDDKDDKNQKIRCFRK